jgi:hypothetical protein
LKVFYRRILEIIYLLQRKVSSKLAKNIPHLSVTVNPLNWVQFEAGTPISHRTPTPEEVLNFLCQPEMSHEITELVDRYRKISIESEPLFVVPYEENFLNSLVWPLRHAKSSFMLGNYVGVLALCGYVSEMLAIFLFEISGFNIGDKDTDDSNMSKLFGRPFEKLGQLRRIEVLLAIGEIDDDLYSLFEQVRIARNKYLHLPTERSESLESDAIETYNWTVSLVVKGLGLEVVEAGKISFKPKVMNFLKKKGLIEP